MPRQLRGLSELRLEAEYNGLPARPVLGVVFGPAVAIDRHCPAVGYRIPRAVVTHFETDARTLRTRLRAVSVGPFEMFTA